VKKSCVASIRNRWSAIFAAWNYFMSLKNPDNDAFIKMYRDYAKAKKLANAEKVVTNDPMEATYVGIHMWKLGG